MTTAASPSVSALLRARQEIDAAIEAIELRELEISGEAPISTKAAAHRFAMSERQARRYAKNGCGRKIGKTWYLFASRIILPEQHQ